MRALVVILGLALWSIPAGWAEPVYFVIDASKSMDADERADALAFVAKTKEGLAQGTHTSTTFFGSADNGGNCGPVVINPLKPVSEDAPDKYQPGNFTPVGTALRAALETAAENDGRVVVISDGADTCEVDVCEVVRRNLRRHPKARRPEFMPIGASDDMIDGYGCFVSAGISGRSEIIASLPPEPIVRPAPWVFVIMGFFAILLAASVVVWIVVMDARARDLGRQIKNLSEKGTASPSKVSRWRYLYSTVPLAIAGAAILLTLQFAKDDFFLGWNWVWWIANLPFGSMLLPAAFLGFSGWALVAAWNTKEVQRQYNDATVMVELEKHRKAEREALAKAKADSRTTRRLEQAAKRRSELLTQILDLRDDARKRQKELLTAVVIGQNNTNLAPTIEKLNTIADTIEELIVGIEDNQTLAAFAVTPRTDYPAILRRLESRNFISAENCGVLAGVFRDWDSFVGGRGELTETTLMQIAEFDLQRLQPQTPPDQPEA